MDAAELGRWTRFASKGGIGKCTALQDCVAEEPELDLMFMKSDEIVVLMQLTDEEDMYLGYCEGVVGRFRGEFVHFHGRLKKPVMAKRSSVAASTLASSFVRSSSSASAASLAAREASTSPLPLHESPAPIHPVRSMSQGISPSPSDPPNLGRIAHSTMSSPSSSPLPVPRMLLDDGHRIRSESHSSNSTGIDSVPLTPSDFPRGGEGEVLIESGSSKLHGTQSSLDVGSSSVAAANQSSPEPPWKTRDFEQKPSPETHAMDMSYLDSEPSTRVSLALSDGEVGIGLSLLQDFMGGGGDDDGASIMSRTYTPPPLPRDTSSPTNDYEAPSVRSMAMTESQYSGSPGSIRHPLPEPQKPYAREAPSRGSMHPSATDSSDWGGEDWEGASDIYDQYRYSRYSMASKMSRLSKGSMYTVASAFGVPPIPSELRNSMDPEANASRERLGSMSVAQHPLRKSSKPEEESVQTLGAGFAIGMGSGADARENNMEDPPTQPITGKPSPLNLVKNERRTSPLLHAAFGSPPGSPDPLSGNPFMSPEPFSPIGPGGAASVLRQRLELERGPRTMSPVVREYQIEDTDPNDRSFAGHDIVVEDDEYSQDLSSSPTLPQAGGTSSGSAYDQSSGSTRDALDHSHPAEKPALASTTTPAHEPAPPPYTMSSPPQSPPGSHTPQPRQQETSLVLPTVRPLNLNRPAADPNARTSLFLPHPNAPRPSLSPTGPMYGREPVPSPHPVTHHSGPPPGSLLHTIHMALAASSTRQSTIYARFEFDLASAVAPVPIFFTLQPPMDIPANRPGSTRPIGASPVPTPTPPPAPVQTRPSVDSAQSPPPPPQQPQPQPDSQKQSVAADGDPPSKAIPRANFFPQAGTARPRSRSFSGFDSPFPATPNPKGRSGEERGATTSEAPAAISLAKRSKSAMATPTAPAAVAAPQRAAVSHTATVIRNFHAPSPLSLSQNNVVASSPPPLSPKLPSSPTRAAAPLAGLTPAPRYAARSSSLPRGAASAMSQKAAHTASNPAVGKPVPGVASSSSSPPHSPLSPLRTSGSLPSLRHSRSTNFTSSTRTADVPQQRSALEATKDQLRLAIGAIGSSERADPPSPVRTVASLKSQSTTLLPRASTDSRLARPDRSPMSPTSSVFDLTPDPKTVQVQDMDFELIQPVIPHSPLANSSVDSLPLSLGSPVRADSGFSFVDPTIPSHSPGFGDRSGFSEAARSEQSAKTASPQDVEGHRQRESKWLQVTVAVPASQARRSKKIRKLLLEGVPASMRYRVWAHLTDSAARRMEGIYTRLQQRDRVAALDDIEHDVQGLFTERPELQDASLVNLLQAYLTMVPDIQYNRGLAVIAAQLLMLTPEEDAFWTFTSLMDTHLRPYFSSNAIQLEVDASLFGKLVEANDMVLAKKLFVDMAIPPVTICRPWFTTLFVDALSPEYFHRVWDIFLFEGITFLFRIGLTIMLSCRRALHQSTRQDALLAILSHPPISFLPSTPEAFLEYALSIKVKDDDVRKQRSKLEAQVKRQTQPRALSIPSSPSARTSSISLPRN